MNQTSLIEDVAERTGLPKPQVASVVKATLDAIAYRVSKGEEVRLTNFGTFRRHVIPVRKVRNPATGEYKRKGSKVPRFSSTGTFRTVVGAGRVVKTVKKAPKSY